MLPIVSFEIQPMTQARMMKRVSYKAITFMYMHILLYDTNTGVVA